MGTQSEGNQRLSLENGRSFFHEWQRNPKEASINEEYMQVSDEPVIEVPSVKGKVDEEINSQRSTLLASRVSRQLF